MSDLRLAFRALRATPIISSVAVLSLALGIGANTAIFSLVNAIALTPPTAPYANRLAVITKTDGAWSRPEWTLIRHRQMFERAAAWHRARLNISPRGSVDLVDGLWASGELFDLMGIRTERGRAIDQRDDRPGGGADGLAAVISHRFWQQRYGGAADAIGRVLTINKLRYTIIGIADRSFIGIDPGFAADVMLPLDTKDDAFLGGGASEVAIFARLEPGQTFETATAELRTAMPSIYDATAAAGHALEPREMALADVVTVKSAAGRNTELKETYEQSLLILMVIVGLVLLVACANIATLLTARVVSRKPEFAVRVALGASPLRIARQLLAESLLLGSLGISGGVVLAAWLGPLLVRQLSNEASMIFLDLSPDWRVLAFTAAVGLLTAILFGIVPALRGSRAKPIDAMKQGDRSITGGRFAFASSMIALQVALSLLLLVSAGLFVRSFVNLTRKDVGFDRDPILIVSVDAGNSTVPPKELDALGRRIMDAVRSAPGVAAAGASENMPGTQYVATPALELGDGTKLPTGGFNGVFSNQTGPGWFDTLNLRIVMGRAFESYDLATAPTATGTVVVNETFARRFLKGSPVGQTIWNLDFADASSALSGKARKRVPLEIVGVARDAMYLFLRDEAPPTVYFPFAYYTQYHLSVRSTGIPPQNLTPGITAAIGRVDPNVLLTFRTLADQVNSQYARDRLTAMVSSFFGALALLLSGLGLYGVTSYAVAQRRAEIGIRMALGASPGGVMWLVMKRVSLVVGAGVVGGATASLWASRLAGNLLYGVRPRDLSTLLGATATLVAVAATAAWLPARRAARIDPAETLRDS